MNRLIVICLLTFFVLAAYAQKPDTVKTQSRTDSLIRKQDSVKSKSVITEVITTKSKKQHRPDSTHSAALAFKRSGFVPGWGQLYNHKWWKVPIIYTGLGLLGAAVVFNQKYYKQYLAVLRAKQNPDLAPTNPNDPVYILYVNTQGASETAIENAVNGYQRNMQLSILGIVGAWGIQMIDAYIDGKFIQSYSMDRDLSFKVSPGIITGPVYAAGNIPSVMPVIKLTFTLR